MHDVYYLNSGPMMGHRALGPCTTTKQKETAGKHLFTNMSSCYKYELLKR